MRLHRAKLDEEAIAYARRLLVLDVASWNDQGPTRLLGSGTHERKSKMRHIIATLDVIRSNLTSDNLPLIEAQLDSVITYLKQAHSAKGRRGQSATSYKPRYRLIAQAVNTVCQRFGYRPTRNPATRANAPRECGCSIVAKALRDNRMTPRSEKRVKEIWEDYSRS